MNTVYDTKPKNKNVSEKYNQVPKPTKKEFP